MEYHQTQTCRARFVRGHFRNLGKLGRIWINAHMRGGQRAPSAAAETPRDIDTIIREGRARLAKIRFDHELEMAKILNESMRQEAKTTDTEPHTVLTHERGFKDGRTVRVNAHVRGKWGRLEADHPAVADDTGAQ